VLGKKSGIDSIRIKSAELGLEVPEEEQPALLDAVKKLGIEKRGLVTDEEFRRLVAEGGAR
jgi:isopropylmalate/homocitrate/citramalate synthase